MYRKVLFLSCGYLVACKNAFKHWAAKKRAVIKCHDKRYAYAAWSSAPRKWPQTGKKMKDAKREEKRGKSRGRNSNFNQY